MKQTLRKILAVLVVFSIVLSVGIIAITGSAAVQTVFEDNFDTGTLAEHVTEYGWSNSNTGSLVDGKYLMKVGYNYPKTVTDKNQQLTLSTALGDYTVEADAQFNTVPASGTPGILLVARVTAANSNGYEFGILRNSTTGQLLTRLRRVSGNVALGGGQKPLSDFGITKSDTDSFHLKMTLKGSQITCWIDDTQIFSVTDTASAKGTVALRTSGSTGTTAYFDNFKVTTGESDASSSQISSEVSSVTGNTSSTPVGGILFNDDFTASGSLTDRGWMYDYEVVDGKMHTNYGTDAHTKIRNYLVTANGQSTMNWSNYSVQATVQMDTSVPRQDAATSITPAVVAYAPAANKGLELGIVQAYNNTSATTDNIASQVLRLYERGGDGKLATASISPNIDLSQPFTLKIEVQGNTVKGYLNGVLMLTYTGITATSGMPGVATTAGVLPMWYSNFIVTQLDENTSSDASSSVSSNESGMLSSNDVPPAGPYSFTDNFNSGAIHADWAYNTGTVVNGVYQINTEIDSGASNWVNTAAAKALADYSVSGDFTFLPGTNTSNQPNLGIAFRTQSCNEDNTGGKGYEYTITYVKNSPMSGINKLNKMYVRLYERNGDGTLAASNVVSVESLLGAGNDSLTATYNLRVEVIGNRIKCFLNDVVAFDTGDDTFATGAFGVRAFHQVGSVDNFAVTEIDQFSQGQLPGGSTSSGTGSTPTYTYPEGVYYQDDFSTADFVNKGWNRDLTVVNGQVEMYSFAGAYLTNRADMKNLTDYTVEAWVTMDDLLPSSTTGKFAGVVARATGSGKGYEFGLYYSNGLKYRLYDRTSGDQLAAGALDFLYGVSYRIRLVVNGNRIMGFVDDRLVADCKHEGNPVGTAGVRQLGYAAYYDNYVVRESTEDEKKGIGAVYTAPKADKNGIYFSDNFNTKASVAGGVWGSILQIKNSQALVPVQGVVTLGGNPGFALLEDYVVQADVTLDVTTELDGGYGHAAIVARGYEFAIFSQSNGEDSYLRLYDRENGKILAKNDEFKIEPGKAYTMTLMVEGNRICAFLDGKLVIDLKDDAHKNGTIGARGMHMEFAMDNFVVRKVTAADRKGTPNVTVPNTGDTLVYVYVSLAIFLAAAIVLLLTKRRAILH